MRFNRKTFQQNLRHWAKVEAGNLRQFELKLGIHHSTMTKWLAPQRGEKQLPNCAALAMLACQTGVSLNWLLFAIGPERLTASRSEQELAKDLYGTVLAHLHKELPTATAEGTLPQLVEPEEGVLERALAGEVRYAEAALALDAEVRKSMQRVVNGASGMGRQGWKAAGGDAAAGKVVRHDVLSRHHSARTDKRADRKKLGR